MVETTRQRLATVDKRIEILESEANKKFQSSLTLRSLRTKLCAEIIAEGRLLAGEWVHVSNEHIVCLQARDYLDDFPRLKELLSPEHSHEDYALWRDMTCLRFDDGVVSLWPPNKGASQFIKDNGITVDWANLTKSRSKLKSQIETVDALIAEFSDD